MQDLDDEQGEYLNPKAEHVSLDYVLEAKLQHPEEPTSP